MYPVSILIYVSIYLCIYIATHLHTAYLDWLQVVLESISWYAWIWLSSELRDTLWGCDPARSEMHLEGVIEPIWRYSGMPWWSEHRDALWDHDRASSEIHLGAMIRRVWMPSSCEFTDKPGCCDRGRWRCISRPWSCEIGCRKSLDEYLQPGWWMLHRVLIHFSSVC
jgi:hypothetical protein